MKKILTNYFDLLTTVACVGSAVATLLGFAGHLYWVLDLMNHFCVFSFGFSLLAVIHFGYGRRYVFLAIASIILLINSFWLAPFFFGGKSIAPIEIQAELEIMTFNVLTSNKKKAEVVKYLLDEDADVIVLLEVNNRWHKALVVLNKLYPYQKHEIRADNFGIIMLSKLPFKSAEIKYYSSVPSVLVSVQVGGKDVRILGTHPVPPIGAGFKSRNAQFAEIAKEEANGKGELIVLGDLNITPWSPIFRDFKAQLNLNDSAWGHGIICSWPSDSVLSIPIDHVLMTDGLISLDKKVGPYLGSDHLPVVVRFAVAK